jgi:acetylornithine aminotransferase
MQLHQRSPMGSTARRCARPARLQRVRLQAAAAVEPPATATGDAVTKQTVADEAKYVLQTYSRPNIVFVEGHGAKMYDANGKEYLDMAAGAISRAMRGAARRGAGAGVPPSPPLTGDHTPQPRHPPPSPRLRLQALL